MGQIDVTRDDKAYGPGNPVKRVALFPFACINSKKPQSAWAEETELEFNGVGSKQRQRERARERLKLKDI